MTATTPECTCRVVDQQKGRCGRFRLAVQLVVKDKADTYDVEPCPRTGLKPVVYWTKRGAGQPEPYRVTLAHDKTVLSCDCPARVTNCRHVRATAALLAAGRLPVLFPEGKQ